MAPSPLPSKITEHYTRLRAIAEKDKAYNATVQQRQGIKISLLEALAPCLAANTPYQQKRIRVKLRKRRKFNEQLRTIQFERYLLETDHQTKRYDAIPVFTEYLSSHDLFFSKLGTLQDHIIRIMGHLDLMKKQAQKVQGSLGAAIGLEVLDVLGSTDLMQGWKRVTELVLEGVSTLASENQNTQATEFNTLSEQLKILLTELNTLSEEIEKMRDETDTYKLQTDNVSNVPQFTRYLERGDLLTGIFGKTEGISGLTLLSHIYTAFRSGSLPDQIEAVQGKLKEYDQQIRYVKETIMEDVMNDVDKLPMAL